MLDTIGATGATAIIAVITLAIASLVGLVLFVSKEETFEDVVAAQKKEQEALLNELQGSSKSSKSNKKKSKLKSKKAKKEDGVPDEADSGVDDDEPSTESVPAVSPKSDEPSLDKKQNKKQKNSSSSEPPVESKSTEKEAPKSSKSSKKNKKEKIKVEEEVFAVDAPVVKSSPVNEEVMIAAVENVQEAAPPPLTETVSKSTKEDGSQKKKSGKKSKPEKKKEGEMEKININRIQKDIEGADLNSVEIQKIVDSLLAKQNENEQWQKPNQKSDPLEQMKKQVSEMDIQLMEERKNSQAAAMKNKELRVQLQQERNQKLAIQAQVGTRMTQQAKEHESQLKRKDEQHISEMQSTQSQIQRMQQLIDGGSSHMELQHLKEENTHLKNASLRASQLSEEKKSLMNELNQLQQGNKQLRQDLENSRVKYQQIEQQIQNTQRASSEALSQRLQEVNEQLLKTEGQNRTLVQQLQQSQADMQNTQLELQQIRSTQDNMAQTKIQEASQQLSDSVNQLKATQQELVNTKAELEKKNNELVTAETDRKQMLATASEKDKLAEQLQKENTDLKSKAPVEVSVSESTDLSATKIAELEAALEEKNNGEKGLQETIDGLKQKNNDLREKNWKAVDAMNKADDESQKKLKSLERNLMKGLKSIHPDVKLPPFDVDNVEPFFDTYKQSVETLEQDKPTSTEQDKPTSTEQLTVDTEELEKTQKENAHLKNVLENTEALLSKLQTGVDAEVSKWQNKVDEKDHELEEANKKITSLEAVLKEHGFEKEEVQQENDNTPTKKKKHGFTYTLTKIIHPKMETQLKETQEKLEQEKKEKESLKEKVSQLEEQASAAGGNKELEDELKTTKDNLVQVKKELEDKQSNSENEVNDLNSKLKKTISERDLLIREYKALKDSSSKLTEASGEHEQEKKAVGDAHTKEIKKLNDQIKALENASLTSGKGDKDKDKLIAKLYLEIEELKDDLREERDRVIVDIETPDAEELHKQVDALIEEKASLNVKLEDLEKSFKEESDKDKIMDLEMKLKASQARVKELESEENKKIQNQIADAMEQSNLEEQLKETQKSLKLEKQATAQLKLQLSAATNGGTNIGTSV